MAKFNTKFTQWEQESLDYWFSLAEIYDSYGLPIDLIYIRCQEKNSLPTLFERATDEAGSKCLRPRIVTAEEFEDGINFCVRVRQVGGLDVLMSQLSNQKQ